MHGVFFSIGIEHGLVFLTVFLIRIVFLIRACLQRAKLAIAAVPKRSDMRTVSAFLQYVCRTRATIPTDVDGSRSNLSNLESIGIGNGFRRVFPVSTGHGDVLPTQVRESNQDAHAVELQKHAQW